VVLLTFLLSGAAVAGAGIRLARDGDTIGHLTGLGGLWVGAILVAAATSLPELTTDIHAIRQGNPSLAVGDLFGSTMANMLILAVADLMTHRPRLLTRVAVNQVLVGVVAVLLTTIAAVGVLLEGDIGPLPIGWPTVAIGIAYVAGMRLLHRNREAPPFQTAEEVAAQSGKRKDLRRAIVGFGLAAIVILVAAPLLAASTADLADAAGMSHGFAGLVLLAATTSMPEAVVSLVGIRARAYGLVVGNLLGSCAFNMAALVPLDLVDGAGSLLAHLDLQLLLGALFGIILLTLAMLDVMNKAERRIWAVEPGPMVMIAAYLIGLFAAYHAG
jgi:cation:H+ antiporter